MAVLNIKSFPDELYETLKALATQEHRSVSQQVVYLLRRAVEEPEPTSILSLRGLGKHHWDDVEATERVDRERRAWD